LYGAVITIAHGPSQSKANRGQYFKFPQIVGSHQTVDKSPFAGRYQGHTAKATLASLPGSTRQSIHLRKHFFAKKMRPESIPGMAGMYYAVTHPGDSHLLPLVERLVEVHERGADRGGGAAHGGKALAHRVHAADRGERALGGAGAAERVGGLERSGDELVERDALRRAQTHVALDLAHRPAAQHRRELFAHGAAPAGRGGLTWGGLARGSLAGGGVGAGAIAAGGNIAAAP